MGYSHEVQRIQVYICRIFGLPHLPYKHTPHHIPHLMFRLSCMDTVNSLDNYGILWHIGRILVQHIPSYKCSLLVAHLSHFLDSQHSELKKIV